MRPVEGACLIGLGSAAAGRFGSAVRCSSWDFLSWNLRNVNRGAKEVFARLTGPLCSRAPRLIRVCGVTSAVSGELQLHLAFTNKEYLLTNLHCGPLIASASSEPPLEMTASVLIGLFFFSG